MVGDIKATPGAVRRCVEEYGSIVHFAEAIGVSPDVVHAWMKGEALPSARQYAEMLDLIARRHSR